MLFSDLEINTQKKLLSENPCSHFFALFYSLVCLFILFISDRFPCVVHTGFQLTILLPHECLGYRHRPHKCHAATSTLTLTIYIGLA